MKRVIPVFAGGLVLGIALTVLFQGAVREESEDQKSESSRSMQISGTSGDFQRERGGRHSKGRNGRDGKWAEQDMEGLFDFLREMSSQKHSGNLNLLALARYGAQIGELDADGARQFIDAMNEMVVENPDLDDFAEIIVGMAFMRWCELSGPEALTALVNSENPAISKNDRDDIAEMGVLAWTQADPEGARAWMDGQLHEIDQLLQKGGNEKDFNKVQAFMNNEGLYKVFLESYVMKKGDKALELFEGIENEKMRNSIRDEVIESMAERTNSVPELKKLLEQSEHGDFGGRREVMRKLAVQATDDARLWVESQSPTKERDNFVTMVASEWLKKDPANAAEWYLKQEMVEPNRGQDRLSRIFSSWSGQDSEGALTWLESQPDTPVRDTAESLAATFAVNGKDYTAAVEWAAGIQNENLRDKAFNRVMEKAQKLEGGEVPAEMMEAFDKAGFEVESE